MVDPTPTDKLNSLQSTLSDYVTDDDSQQDSEQPPFRKD